MSWARMSHEDLERFADYLAKLRDEEIAAAVRYPSAAELFNSRASGFRLALDALHTHSHGQYGQTLDEQIGGAS